MTKRLTRTLLGALALSFGTLAGAMQPPTPNYDLPRNPAEACRGLGGEAFTKCEGWVNADMMSVQMSRAGEMQKQIAGKPLPVILQFRTGLVQNAQLTHAGVGGRVVPAGAIIKVDCEWRTKKDGEEDSQYAAGSCHLKFPNMKPDWKGASYQVHFGEQTSAWVGMDKDGFLDTEYVQMLDPIPSPLIESAK